MFNKPNNQAPAKPPRINEDDLWGVYNESTKRRQRIEEQAVRKGLNLPCDDGMRDFSVTNQHPPRERSPLETLIFGAAAAAIVATPIGGLLALPSILNALKPEPAAAPPAAIQPSQQPTPPAVAPEFDDTNDVFELGLHPPQN